MDDGWSTVRPAPLKFGTDTAPDFHRMRWSVYDRSTAGRWRRATMRESLLQRRSIV